MLIPSPAPAELTPAPAPVPAPAPAKLAKPKKRSRGMGPPFNEVLYAQSGRMLRVKLEVPGPDEECPLTLSPIADDALEFLQPTTAYITAFPEVKKMTLPCGHAFGALSVLYHFARRNMLCPCCRAGIDSRLSSHCIPSFFRKNLLSRVQRELRADSDELIEADQRAASSFVYADASSLVYVLGVEFVRVDYMLPGNVSLNVRFLGQSDLGAPPSTYNVPLIPSQDAVNIERYVFSLPGGSVRGLFDLLLVDPSITSLELTTVVDFAGGRTVEVARSGRIDIDRSQNRDVFSISAEGDSWFFMELHAGASRVFKLEWTVPAAFLSTVR